MSVQTIYRCDKCGAEQLKADQFWTVGIMAYTHGYSSTTFVQNKSIEVCRSCLESFGIHVQRKNDEPPPKELTVEELIREIITRCQP